MRMKSTFSTILLSVFLLSVAISFTSCSETTSVMLNSVDVCTNEVVLTANNPYAEFGVASLVAESWYMIVGDSRHLIYRGRAENWDGWTPYAILWEGEWLTVIELIGFFGRNDSAASFALLLTPDYQNLPSEEKSITVQIIGGGNHPTINTVDNHHTITIRFVPD